MTDGIVENSTSVSVYPLAKLIGARIWLEGAYENPPLAGTIVDAITHVAAQDRDGAIARNKFTVRLDNGKSFTLAGTEFMRVEG